MDGDSDDIKLVGWENCSVGEVLIQTDEHTTFFLGHLCYFKSRRGGADASDFVGEGFEEWNYGGGRGNVGGLNLGNNSYRQFPRASPLPQEVPGVHKLESEFPGNTAFRAGIENLPRYISQLFRPWFRF